MGETAGGRAIDEGWLARDVLARQASVRPEGLALNIFATGERVTYAKLEDRVRRCDAFLREAVTPGARIALLARNSLHHVELFYGCPRAGAIFQPLNWRLTGPELAVLLEDADPELLIYEAEFEAEAQAALAASPARRVIRIGGPSDDPFAAELAAMAPLAPQPITPTAPYLLLYTSGTTGRPKGVVITPKSAFYSSMNFTYLGELTAGHAQLCDVPMFHTVALFAILHSSVLAGATVHLADRFDPAATLQRLADPELRISHYFCVPQIAQTLLEAPGSESFNLAGLRVFTGGAPMPAHLTLALLDRGVRPSNGFGMSENGSLMHVPLDPQVARRKVGSVGVAGPAVEVRLVTSEGRDAADGEVGEVWLRGPSVTKEYWNQPEATAKAFSGDWFRTGDAARRDEDGFYFIVDRWKDMYITGGENVYPAEVEAVIGAMPHVAETAVVGVPDARWGETGCAFVVLRAGADCAAAEVAAWCESRLARYKRPTHIRFVEALPRTASGKVQKDRLRRAFAEPAS